MPMVSSADAVVVGGSPAEISAGDTAVFPRGWTGTWQIHETLREVYVIFG